MVTQRGTATTSISGDNEALEDKRFSTNEVYRSNQII